MAPGPGGMRGLVVEDKRLVADTVAEWRCWTATAVRERAGWSTIWGKTQYAVITNKVG